MTTTPVPTALLDRLTANSLLTRVVRRNPTLVDAAIRLHQDNQIPPNTW
jgi:hypothetical protein